MADEARMGRLYRRTVRLLLPRTFRRQHGDELVEVFVRLLAEAYREGGLRAPAMVWLRELASLLVLAWRLRRQGREQTERVWTGAGISWIDVKLGLRRMRRYWGLTTVGGLAMTTAITIGAVVVGVVGAIGSASVPLDEGQRVVAVQIWDVRAARRGDTPVDDFERWRRELRSLEDVGAFQTSRRNLITDGGPPEPVTIAEMTASGFQLARVRPLLGRPLLSDDELAGAAPVLVIGFDVWRARFASDPQVVGRGVRLGETVHTVVGVMPDGFEFPVNHQFWVPLGANGGQLIRTSDGQGVVFARLASGSSVESAQAELAASGLSRMAAGEPDRDVELGIVPYTFAFTGDVQRWQLRLGFVLLALILIPPCANLAILMYARTVARHEEFTVRHALGASRGRIVSQLSVEVLVLAAAAGGAALVIVRLLLGELERFLRLSASDVPFWFNPNPSAGTVLYVTGLVLLGALVAGLLPALRATRHMGRSALAAVGGRTGPRLGATWTTLVVAQVALSVAAVPLATEMTWGTLRTGMLGPGFAAEEFFTARLELSEANPRLGLQSEDAATRSRARFRDLRLELVRQVEAEAGISSATLASFVPAEGPWGFIEVEPVDGTDPALPPPALLGDHQVQLLHVDEAFFGTFEMPILSGRGFDARDLEGVQPVVIVSQTFSRKVFGDRSPLGHRLRYLRRSLRSDAATWHEIVGVVDDLPKNSPTGRAYHPAVPGEVDATMLLVHMEAGEAGLTGRVREMAASLDPGFRVTSPRTMDLIYEQQAWGNNIGALVTVAAMLSVLLLSAAGMYALLSFTVNQRRREIGIRSALGAQPGRLLLAVFRRALGQLGAGALLGALFAVLVDVYVPIELLEAVGGWNVPGVLPATGALIVTIGLLAAVGPARRAVSVGPSEAMREGT